jgi:cellulose synthase operon protein C
MPAPPKPPAPAPSDRSDDRVGYPPAPRPPGAETSATYATGQTPEVRPSSEPPPSGRTRAVEPQADAPTQAYDLSSLSPPRPRSRPAPPPPTYATPASGASAVSTTGALPPGYPNVSTPSGGYPPVPRPFAGSMPEGDEAWRVEVRERCTAELATTPDPIRTARLRYELARASRDDDDAVAELRLALASHGEHLPSLRMLRRLLVTRREIEEAAKLFDVEIRLEPDARRRARLYFDKGRALEDFAKDGEAARRGYEEATRLDPGEPLYFRALEQAQEAGARWQALGDALLGEANAVVHDARQRAALMAQRARLFETRLDRTEDAVELYQQALALDPQTGGAQAALKRLLHVRGRWRELCTVLEREAVQTGDTRVQAQALFIIGRIQSERLGNVAEAAAALARAMQVAPGDRLVHDCLERLYIDTRDHTRLAHVLAHAVDQVAEPRERVGLMARIGEIFEQALDDADQAVRWYDAALSLEPTFPPALNALDRLYERSKSWEALIVMHLAAAEGSRDARRRAAAHTRIGEIFERHVRQPEESMRHHRQALALAPTHEASFKALVRLYRTHKRHRELVELYERGIERSGEQDLRFAYLFSIGALHEDELGAPAEAMHTYRRILDEAPEHLGALHAMQRAAERAERWRELVEALEAEAKLTGDPVREVALLHRAGDVLASMVGDREAAVARFRAVLAIDDRHAPTLSSLGKVLHALGRHADLRDVYERELAIAAEGSPQVNLLHQLGGLAEHELGDAKAAIDYYRRAVAIDAGHGPSLRALAHLLRAAGDHEGLLEVARAEITTAPNAEARAAAAYRLGEIHEVHLDDDARALAAYGEALEAEPTHRPSLEGSIRVRERMAEWEAQARALEDEARRVEDHRLAIDALLRAGAIYADLVDQPARAIAAYEGVRSIERTHHAALLALEPLYRAAADPQSLDKLADVYATQAQTLGDLRARLSALEELARLHERRGDLADLRKTYLSMLGEDATHPAALTGLSRIARQSGDQALAADVARRLARVEHDPSLVATCHNAVGEALESASPDAALAAFRNALALEPESIAAIRGVARTAQRCGDLAALIDALEREAAWTSDGQHAAEALVRASEVRLSLADRDGAVDCAARALERWSDHAAAARTLGDLLRETGEIDRLITLLTRAASEARSAERRASLWRVVARLYADEKGDVGAGLAALDRLLAEEEVAEASTWALAGELRARNLQWQEAAEAYEQALKSQPPRDVRLRVLMSLGRLYADRLDRPDASVEALESVVAIDPEQRDALLLLHRLHQAAGNAEAVRGAVVRLLGLTSDPEERAWLFQQQANAELALGRRKAAAAALHEAVVVEGPAGEAAQGYKRLLGDDEPWQRYVEALEKHLVAVRRGEVRARSELRDVYITIARIEHEVLLETDKAISTLRRGSEELGQDTVLQHELAERLHAMGQRQNAVTEYRRLVARDPADVRAWRGMARALHESGRKLEAGVVLAPIVAMGEATDLEASMSRTRKVGLGWARPGSFGRDALRTLSAADRLDESRIQLLLDTIGEAVPKLHAPELELFGVTPRDRLDDQHPLKARVIELSTAFGVEAVDVYLHAAAGRDVAVLAAERPALMVPTSVYELPEGPATFLIARAISVVGQGTTAALALGPGRTRLLVAAALRNASPHYGGGSFPEEELEIAAKRLGKALSRKNRKQLEQVVAPQCLSDRPIDLDRWGPTVLRTITRASTLVTNDLPATIDALRHTGEVPPSLRGADLVRRVPAVADIFRFWASSEASELRIAAGIV